MLMLLFAAYCTFYMWHPLFDIHNDSYSWKYLLYNDDVFNFLEAYGVNRTHVYVTSFDSFDNLKYTASLPGINVYEPAWNLYKACIMYFWSSDSRCIRIVSACNHLLNAVLLYSYMYIAMTPQNQSKSSRASINSSVTGSVCLLLSFVFLVHPLNVSVIGWCSAQGYVISLTLGLCSSISLETSLRRLGTRRPVEAGAWMGLSLLGCVLAVMVSDC